MLNENFPTQPCAKPNPQGGVALIEALVALLVLALGILGMAGLQTRTVSESRETNFRSIAIQLTEDIGERIRLNPESFTLPINPYAVGFFANPAAPIDCNAAACNTAQLAAFDINQWKNTVAATLQGGDAQIYISPNDPTQFGILIGWRTNVSRRGTEGDAADTASYLAPTQVNTGVPGAACPADLTCHLVLLRP